MFIGKTPSSSDAHINLSGILVAPELQMTGQQDQVSVGEGTLHVRLAIGTGELAS